MRLNAASLRRLVKGNLHVELPCLRRPIHGNGNT